LFYGTPALHLLHAGSTSSTADMKPPRWSGWQYTKLFFSLQETVSG